MHVVLSSVVMAHPKRLGAARALVEAHPELELRIVTDPEPDAAPHALRTARLAWAAVADGATHHLVVQDDMLLVPGFAEYARRAAAAMPGRILCFFCEWGSRTSHALRLATVEGDSWVPVLDPYIPTSVILYPAEVARDLAGYAPGDGSPDDVLLLRYVRERGLTPVVSVPNLAEHTPVPSLVGNDIVMGPRRSAWCGDGPLGTRVWQGSVVPHLLMFEGFSICHVRHDDGGWRPMRTHQYLDANVGDLLAWFQHAIADTDGGGAIRAVVAEPLLFQLWLTALAYGAVAKSAPIPAALRTLGPGALRRFIPLSYLDGLPALVGPAIDQAIRFASSIGKNPSK